MKIIGLTGGIGSGKTTVSEIFKIFGFPVYNSDIEAKKLMNSDINLINKLKKIFGNEIYDKKNKLNRKKLADIIFSDKNKLNEINNIVHPEVKKHFEKWLSKQKNDYVIKETAILFETGIYKNVDIIISVIAPQETRIKRIIKRDNNSRKNILQRMKNQTDDNFKKENSNYIIYNDEHQLIIPQIIKIIDELRKNSNKK